MIEKYTGKFKDFTEEDFKNYARENYNKQDSRLVFTVGINDSDYMIQIEDREWSKLTGKRVVVWRCKVYQHWMSMLRRCIDPKLTSTVSEEWKIFSKFSKWYYNNEYSCEEPFVVDKDLKILGNKVYSSETCLLLPKTLNSSIGIRGSSQYLTGASWKKKNKQFQSQIFINGGKIYLGLYPTELQAHRMWLKVKMKYILSLKSINYPLEINNSLDNLSNFLRFCLENEVYFNKGNVDKSFSKFKSFQS